MNLKITLTALLSAGLVTAATAQQLPRLQAQSHYGFDGTNYSPTDSVKYSYGGTRGSSPQPFGNMDELFDNSYDRADSFRYTGGTWSQYARTSKTYNGNNLDERTMESYDGTNWNNEDKVTVEYKSGKPDTARYDYWSTQGSGNWRSSSKVGYTWSGNYPATITRIAWRFGGGGSSGWRNDYHIAYTYSSGNITSETIQQWDNNNSMWVNDTKQDITYGGNGPTVFTNSDWDNGANNFILQNRGTYTYSSGRQEKLTEDYTTNAGSTWENSAEYRYYYAGTGAQPDTMTYHTWDPFSSRWNNTRRYIYTYNSYGQVTKIVTESWNNAWAATSSDDMTNYYYDLHPTNVANTNPLENSINVFPSPAATNVKVQVGTKIGQVLHYALTGVNGTVVKRWSAVNNGLAQDVSVNELPAGNYFMVVHDGQHVTTKQFTVVK